MLGKKQTFDIEQLFPNMTVFQNHQRNFRNTFMSRPHPQRFLFHGSGVEPRPIQVIPIGARIDHFFRRAICGPRSHPQCDLKGAGRTSLYKPLSSYSLRLSCLISAILAFLGLESLTRPWARCRTVQIVSRQNPTHNDTTVQQKNRQDNKQLHGEKMETL